MATITKITAQQKNPDRANLFVDGEFFGGISKVVAVNHRLIPGMEIDEQALRKIVFESDKDGAFAYALSYIARYTPTQKQLTDKLYAKGYGKTVVNYAIEKACAYGYLDDEEYARSYASLNASIKGVVRIKNDLIAKGVDRQIVERVLSDFEPNDSCLLLARKHARGQDLDDPKYRARLARFLTYRGYERGDVSHAIDTLKNERGER